jgi:hypothetical protein
VTAGSSDQRRVRGGRQLQQARQQPEQRGNSHRLPRRVEQQRKAGREHGVAEHSQPEPGPAFFGCYRGEPFDAPRGIYLSRSNLVNQLKQVRRLIKAQCCRITGSNTRPGARRLLHWHERAALPQP